MVPGMSSALNRRDMRLEEDASFFWVGILKKMTIMTAVTAPIGRLIQKHHPVQKLSTWMQRSSGLG